MLQRFLDPATLATISSLDLVEACVDRLRSLPPGPINQKLLARFLAECEGNEVRGEVAGIEALNDGIIPVDLGVVACGGGCVDAKHCAEGVAGVGVERRLRQQILDGVAAELHKQEVRGIDDRGGRGPGNRAGRGRSASRRGGRVPGRCS